MTIISTSIVKSLAMIMINVLNLLKTDKVREVVARVARVKKGAFIRKVSSPINAKLPSCLQKYFHLQSCLLCPWMVAFSQVINDLFESQRDIGRNNIISIIYLSTSNLFAL